MTTNVETLKSAVELETAADEKRVGSEKNINISLTYSRGLELPGLKG